MLTRVAQDAQRALLAVEQTDGLLEDESGQGCIGAAGRVDRPGLRCRSGRRSPAASRDQVGADHLDDRPGDAARSQELLSQRFDGYKLSAAVSNSSEPLIMAVHVAPGGESRRPAGQAPDRRPAARTPAQSGSSATPRTATVSCAQSSPSAMWTCSRRSRKATVVEDRVGKRDFTIDPAAGTVTCPAGHTATITTSKKGVRTARISRAACGGCPLQGPVLPRPAEPTDRARRARRVDDRRPPGAR